jgi:predicted permease
MNDIRQSIRVLLKYPGFSAIVIITLALGIGANTAIFSVTDRLLLRSLPVSDPDQLVLISSVSVNPNFVSNSFSYPLFNDFRTQNKVFDGMLAFTRTELELKTNESMERIPGEYVSGNYFDVLGIQAARGRTFLREEDQTPGSQPVVFVSDAFSRKHFGGGQNAVGQKITLNDVPLTVVGVAPENFTGMTLERPTELWVPVLMHPQLAQSKYIESRTDGFLYLMGRLKSDVSAAQAESSMDLLAQQIKEANTPAGTTTKGLPFSEQHIKFQPGGKGRSLLRGRFSSPLKLLMVVVGLVLLIACANIAGLLLARGVTRRKEMAIRLAVGANSWRVVRQLLAESLVLAISGGLVGLLIAPWLITLLTKTQPRLDLARTVLAQGIDRRVLAFTALTTLVAGIIFGIFPAWQSSRANLLPVLKEEGGISGQRERRFTFRSLLVVSQLALAIVVLIGAGLCVKSLRNLLAIDPGYNAETLLVVPLDLDEKKYDEASGRVFQHHLYARLETLPGVEAVSHGLVMPFSGSRFMSSIFVQGSAPVPNEQMAFDASVVGPNYHETMGIQMAQGRGFTDEDREGSPGVVIINEALARRLFPGGNALGQRLTTRTDGPPMEIVGITGDVKHHELTETPVPHFDLPALQRGYDSYTNFVIRTRGPAAELIPTVRSELLELDPALSVKEISAVSTQIDNTLAATRLASTLISIFGLVALLLASIGLYGVMAWMVSHRTREVGIRMALGARPADVLKLVLKQGLVLTLIGVVIGLFAAFLATRLIDTQQLYGVSATDPFTFAVIALLLTAVSLLACYLPARRATKVDPLTALRYE